MPLFSDLLSDYPLNLTLLERPYAVASKQSYTTVLTSARRIPVPVIGSTWWFLSRLLVDRAFDAQHYRGANGRHCHSVEPRICTGSRTNFCSSACDPSATESTCGLTHVRASVREFRLHIDDHLEDLVEYWCSSPRGNAELASHELAASLLSPKPPDCAVVEVHMLSTSRPHSPITAVLCPACQMRNATEGVHFGPVTLCLSVRGQQGKSDQLRSDQLKEEHMMSQSRGAVSFEPLFTAEDIGLRKEANVEHVMKVFITLGEGLASRWIEMPKGVLLLQTVPDNPASGAIYLYDRELHVFYFVVFDEGRDDSLTAAEFDELVTEYNLVSWTAHPALLRKAIGKPAMA
jgi:hypothetical protein